jgi:hypothetical protein
MGAILWTEFGLQVRLPQGFSFNHLRNTESRCDAGVTQLNASGKPAKLTDYTRR